MKFKNLIQIFQIKEHKYHNYNRKTVEWKEDLVKY